MEETTAVRRLSGKSLCSSLLSSTYIPLDIIQETVLCRLPVKSLLRFRCICKSWDSLTSKDLKFAKKHLRVSPKRQHLVTTIRREAEELTVMSCSFDSLNLHSNFDSKSTQLDCSPINISNYGFGLVASCDGILCFAIDERLAVLYNPCIRKLQKLPYIDIPGLRCRSTHYGFGYDPFIDNYKVVAVSSKYDVDNSYVHSYTLGTDSWKRIKDFPSMFSSYGFFESEHGIFMRGTVNWLANYKLTYLNAIVSLHLEKESYQEISLPNLPDQPNYHENAKILTLYVMRDCLCVFQISRETWSNSFIDVWLMKEYGNKESWIKLICIPFFGEHAYNTNIVYISEDNNVLLDITNNPELTSAVYDFKNNTVTTKISKIQGWEKSKVYVESLISP